MTRLAAAAIAILLLSVSTAAASDCDHRYPNNTTCDLRPAKALYGKQWKETARKAKPFRAGHRVVHRKSGRAVHAKAVRSVQRPAMRLAGRAHAAPSLAGVIPALAQKASQIVSECGSWVMSAVRNTQVAGSGRLSCHAYGKAVDIAGNPSCIYAHLRGWSGGYSTDYSRVRCRGVLCPHVHVSLGCSEDGKRFVHSGSRPRHARRHHRMARS